MAAENSAFPTHINIVVLYVPTPKHHYGKPYSMPRLWHNIYILLYQVLFTPECKNNWDEYNGEQNLIITDYNTEKKKNLNKKRVMLSIYSGPL